MKCVCVLLSVPLLFLPVSQWNIKTRSLWLGTGDTIIQKSLAPIKRPRLNCYFLAIKPAVKNPIFFISASQLNTGNPISELIHNTFIRRHIQCHNHWIKNNSGGWNLLHTYIYTYTIFSIFNLKSVAGMIVVMLRFCH